PRAKPHEPTRAAPHSPDPFATQRQPAASPSRDANGTGSNPTPTTAGSVVTASAEAQDASGHRGRNGDPSTQRGDRSPAPPAPATGAAAGTPGGNAAPAPTNTSPGTSSQGAPPVAASSVARAGTTAAPSKLATPKPTPTDRQGVINQANRALGLALRAKDGSVRFNLAPDHLGSLRVEIVRGQHGVSARFEAASQQAREILESSIEHLRASLEARGLRVDRLEVRVAEAAGPERGGAPTPRPGGSEHPDAGESAEHGSDPDAERGQDGGHDRRPGSGAWADRGTDAGASGSERWSREEGVGGAEPPSGDRTRAARVVPGYAPWDDGEGVALVEIVV
ncbi:MAG: flagellar hook-length control protein FliK, partial [Phycisphaerales bacterium]|nr:flagellar hook-length control protein FliK [Phycisphaerales bacterium]